MEINLDGFHSNTHSIIVLKNELERPAEPWCFKTKEVDVPHLSERTPGYNTILIIVIVSQ